MKYSVDHLYSYVNKEGNTVDRYLMAFKVEENTELKNVEFDIEYTVHENNRETSYVNVIYEESDELTEDERGLLFYMLDRWAIQNLD